MSDFDQIKKSAFHQVQWLHLTGMVDKFIIYRFKFLHDSVYSLGTKQAN